MSHGNNRRILVSGYNRYNNTNTQFNSPINTDYVFAGTLAIDNPLDETSGGTGKDMFSKGDILVGHTTTSLNKLSIDDDGLILTADSTATDGVKWAPKQVNFPRGYVNMADPRPYNISSNTNCDYKIEYVYARSQFDEVNLRIDWSRNVSVSLALKSESSLGTASVPVNSSTITLSNNGANNFRIGDVITINSEGRRVIGINSASSITVDTPFQNPHFGQPYYRGGSAPNTTYYLYIIGDGGENVQLALSTRCFADYDSGAPLVDLPTGFPKFRQLWPVFITNRYGGLAAFQYSKNKMISFYNPNNILNAALFSSQGFCFAESQNTESNYPISNHYNLNIPKTMKMIYMQTQNNGIIDSAINMRDGTLTLYHKDTTTINTTGGTAAFVFLGGMIQTLNVMGAD
jgi:hypothetical protein